MAQIVLKLGDDVSTDIIYPGRFMATVLPTETPEFAFADDVEFNAALRRGQITPGSVILAGRNFGNGSSREQAASTLKGHELVVVARSFARIFRQNAVNLGLKTVACPNISARCGDELDIGSNEIRNLRTGESFAIVPLAATHQGVVDAGGLIAFVRQRLIEAERPD